MTSAAGPAGRIGGRDRSTSRWPYAGSGHVLTIDVEEYFHGPAFDGAVTRGDWDYLPARVAPCLDRWLELLEIYGTRATFFVLGWVADRNPDAIRRIAEEGHEVASRGWDPGLMEAASAEAILDEVRGTKVRLAEIAGRPVHGFRAPRTPSPADRERLLDALVEAGHVYDSSVPRPRSSQGLARASRAPFIVTRPPGRIVEVPTGGLGLGPIRVPGPGGSWLRQLPYAVTRRSLASRRGERVWSLFRVRSWEIDPDQPHIPLPPIGRFRHYRNLGRFEERLCRLLSEFRFASLAERLGLEDEEARRPDEDGRADEGRAARSGAVGA